MPHHNLNIDLNKSEITKKTDSSINLTRLLFESQSDGLSKLYEMLNEGISINKIIEDSKTFPKSNNKSLRKICL